MLALPACVCRLLDRPAAFTVEPLPTTGPLLDAAWARLLTTDERLARAVPGLAMPL